MKTVKDNLIVKVNYDKSKIIVTVKDEAAVKGEVIACGKKVEEVKVGDNIEFSPFAGFKIIKDNIEYRIMKEDQVMMIC